MKRVSKKFDLMGKTVVDTAIQLLNREKVEKMISMEVELITK